MGADRGGGEVGVPDLPRRRRCPFAWWSAGRRRGGWNPRRPLPPHQPDPPCGARGGPWAGPPVTSSSSSSSSSLLSRWRRVWRWGIIAVLCEGFLALLDYCHLNPLKSWRLKRL
jgi:hypothetical protein